MNLQSLVDTASLSIAYDQANDWLYVDWKGVHTQESSKLGCIMMLECLRQHPCPKILNDNSSIIRTEFQLTAWSHSWLREMHEAGLECLAWVFPAEFSSRQATEKVLALTAHPTLAAFDDLASAYLWLKNFRLPGPVLRNGYSAGRHEQPR